MSSDRPLTPKEQAWYDYVVAKHFPSDPIRYAGPHGSEFWQAREKPDPYWILATFPIPADWKPEPD